MMKAMQIIFLAALLGFAHSIPLTDEKITEKDVDYGNTTPAPNVTILENEKLPQRKTRDAECCGKNKRSSEACCGANGDDNSGSAGCCGAEEKACCGATSNANLGGDRATREAEKKESCCGLESTESSCCGAQRLARQAREIMSEETMVPPTRSLVSLKDDPPCCGC